MRYACISRHRGEYPVRLMCETLHVGVSSYHAWRKGTTPSQRQIADEILMARAWASFTGSRGTYGSPRVHEDLKDEGFKVGRKRVARLMRQAGMSARRRKRGVRTTDSNHTNPIAPNVVDRRFAVVEANGERPWSINQAWVADITYLPTAEGWLYLAAVLDLASRRCIGWSMQETLETALASDALRMALETRRPPTGLLYHTDRGVQYTSADHGAIRDAHGIIPSMSRRGNCWDNAVAESFFATVETELIDRLPHGRWETRSQARSAVFGFIETWYNSRRRHSSLGYLSPAQYEVQLDKAA